MAIQVLKSDGTVLSSIPDGQVITFDNIAFMVVEDETYLSTIPTQKGTAILKRYGSISTTSDYGNTWS